MNRPLCFVGVALALVGGLASSAPALTIRVPQDRPTIAAALATAAAGDSVVLACGTYYEHDVPLRNRVTLRGENGDPSCVTVNAQRLGRVFSADVDTTVIEGITVTMGLAPQGAGFNFRYCCPTLRDVRILDCSATQGSGVYALGGSLRCERVILARNSTTAMYFWQTAVELVGCSAYQQGITAQSGAVITATRNIASLGGTCNYSGNPLYCNAAANDFRLDSTSPCLPGVTCIPLIGACGTCGAVSPRTYTITTNPPGFPIVVDGAPYTSPATFTWNQYTEHTIEAADTVSVGAGSRRVFGGWSDLGARAHGIWATRNAYTWTATYDLQNYLTMTTSNGGSAIPSSDWHRTYEPVTIRATPSRGYLFDRWEGSGGGSYSGTSNPATIYLSSPITENARFSPEAYEFSISASDVDAHANTAPPAGGLRSLYLWVTCSHGGLAAFEAEVNTPLPIIAFDPLNGVLNAGTARHLLLGVPNCPTGDALTLLLGRWTVYEAAGGTVCMGRAFGLPGWQLPIAAVDCGTLKPFAALSPGVTGYSSSDAPPCRSGTQTCAGAGLVATTDAPALSAAPLLTALLPSTPNPFGSSAGIHFTLAAPGRAAVRIYDVAGRLVRSLATEELAAGAHELTWDGHDSADRVVPNGVYFVRLETGGTALTRKLVRLAP